MHAARVLALLSFIPRLRGLYPVDARAYELSEFRPMTCAMVEAFKRMWYHTTSHRAKSDDGQTSFRHYIMCLRLFRPTQAQLMLGRDDAHAII